MITDVIVLTSLVLTVAFVLIWAMRADVRAWIERPKYHFQDSVRGYDRGQAVTHQTKEAPSRD